MAAIIGHDRPEISAPGAFQARLEHRRTGLIDEDAIGAAQMGLHVVDDRHQMELRGTVAPVGRRKPPKRAADPVAERAAIEVDPLALEDFGLAVEWQMIAEFRDDNPGDEQLGGQTAGHDMLGGMRLRHSLRAAAAGVFRAASDQHPELGGDRRGSANSPGDRFLILLYLADLRHLATAARTLGAGGLDHPLDPGQMRRQMAAVSPGPAGRFHALPPQRCLGPFLRSLEHALGQFGIFQG